jgi:fibronectin type III domain protein
VTAPESSGAVLNWDPNTESNMAGYKVYVGTASGVYGPAVNVGNVTTFKVINLSKGKTYYFAITAIPAVMKAPMPTKRLKPSTEDHECLL